MTTEKKPPFILVDGSSYLHRAYHALPPLMNSQGQPTGAIYGVINMLRKLVKEYQPKYMAVVFDAKGKTFRHELYKDYKANRPPMPDDLKCQIEPLHKIIRAMNVPILVIEGVEADDVIGTLATKAAADNRETLISTSDKDFAQLVTDKITLIDTMSNRIMDPKGVKEKFGVPPEQIIDYLALIGDTSDNVPGVEKVGPKTAVKWLEQYGSLENIIKHADEIGGKVGENLRKAIDSHLALSKKLVTISCDIPLDVKITELVDKPDDTDSLYGLFKTLEFNSWLSDLTPSTKSTPSKYQMVVDDKALLHWVSKIKTAKIFAIDTETTSLDSVSAKLVGISLAVEPHKAAYIPLQHDYEGAPKQLPLQTVLAALKPILEDENILKIGQNIKYDLTVFSSYDIHLKGVAFDTMLESYTLNSTASRHNMDALAQKYLDYHTISYEDVAGKGAKQISFNKVKVDEATTYAAEDADITLQLHHTLWPQLKENEKLKTLFETIEMPLVSVLSRMERHGILLDVNALAEQSKIVTKRLAALEEKIFKGAGEPFNIDSPKQLQEILFEKLELPVIRKTPTGQPSTAEDVLQELALEYEIPELILEYRSLQKLKNTYIDRLPEQVDKHTGRIHTSFNQAVTSTGRLSSSDPNLQNIPIRTEEGRKIREAFIAPENYEIVAADYSQIELRIMAHLSQDPGLLKAFSNGDDIHTATAAEVFGIKIKDVTRNQRRQAKAINFGLIYGMSSFGLAKQIGVDRKTAQAYIDSYFERYPHVKEYMEKMRDFAHKHEYVETLFGRRLYIPGINAKNIMIQRAAERAAINAPMQGTAADIIKRAMIDIDAWILKSKTRAHMLLQVHDELVFEVHQDDLEKTKKKINDLMTQTTTLAVPITIEIGTAKNWLKAH